MVKILSTHNVLAHILYNVCFMHKIFRPLIHMSGVVYKESERKPYRLRKKRVQWQNVFCEQSINS